MKRIKIIVGVARPYDTFLPGEIRELPDADAEKYLALGYAQLVESAMVEPKVERAVKARARGRS